MNWSWLTRDKLMGMTMGVLLYPVIQQSAPFFVTGALASLAERITFPMIEQRIEVVRRAAWSVTCPPNVADAPVVQAILDWEQRRAHEVENNRVPWTVLDLMATDEWNRIRPLTFPCEIQEVRR